METTALALPVAQAPADARERFIRQTYLHVGLAVLAFAALEALLLRVAATRDLAATMVSGYSWLVVLVAFGAVSMVADRWARSATSVGVQYLGLGLYVVAEAVIFLPMMHWTRAIGDPNILPTAAAITFTMAAGLTAYAFVSGTDFSFLGGALCVGWFVALGAIVCGVMFGFSLGIGFALLMVGFACATILYQTSQVLRTYRTDQHVAASLALFAAVALLFWYVLRIVIAFSGED
jgi:FtsH-binding integral membrane protein